MEKKRLIERTVLSIIVVFSFLMLIYAILIAIKSFNIDFDVRLLNMFIHQNSIPYSIIITFIYIFYFTASIGTLLFKNWARISLIAMSLIAALISLVMFPCADYPLTTEGRHLQIIYDNTVFITKGIHWALFIAIAIFLTRSKIKERFSRQ